MLSIYTNKECGQVLDCNCDISLWHTHLEEQRCTKKCTVHDLKVVSGDAAAVPSGPYCVALYHNDDPEHADELRFPEGAKIVLTRVVNDEWYVFDSAVSCARNPPHSLN